MKKQYIVLLISVLIFALALFFASKLTIASNMEDMLGNENKAMQASIDFETHFASQDQVILMLEKAPKISASVFDVEAKNYMNQLHQELIEKDYVDSVYHRFDIKSLEPFAWAYLDMDYYIQISQALEEEDMQAISQILAEIATLEESNQYEYLQSKSGAYYMMIIKPRLLGDDFIHARDTFYYGIKETIDETYKETSSSSFTVGLTGGGFIQDLEADSVAFDGLFSTLLITILIVIIILIAFLRTLKLPLLAIYPLLFGAVLASAAAYVIYLSLNMFAVSFALLLIGLGIDFGVHIITRYQEEKAQNKSTQKAVSIAVKHTGKSIVFGAITTAFAFASFAVADFQAFEQMGVIAAIGIIGLALTMLLIMPALILTFDTSSKTTKGFVSLQPIQRFLPVIIRKRAIVFVGLILLLLGLSFQLKNVTLRTGMDAIYPDNIPSQAYVDLVEEEFDYSTETLSTYVNTFEELYEVTDELHAIEGIKEVKSILDFLPENQDQKLQIIQQLNTTLTSLGHEGISGYNLSLVTIEDLPSNVKQNFISTTGVYRLEIVPNIDVYQYEQYKQIEDAIVEITDNYPVGIPVLMNQVAQMVQQDILLITTICLFTVALIVLIIFRTLKAILITMLPLLLTLYTTIMLLPILGIEMNIFSIAAFPLIIGIGIDSGIHLYHRFLEPSMMSISTKTSLLSKAILLTTLTTMVGFGSLSMINHPGMSNLGLTVALGIGISFLYTTLLLPIFYTMLHKQEALHTTEDSI